MTAGVLPCGIASAITRPTSLPLFGILRPRMNARVLPTSALLTGASLTNPDLKCGPIAAMKFMVSSRLKLLLIAGVGAGGGAEGRLIAAGGDRSEIDVDRGRWGEGA